MPIYRTELAHAGKPFPRVLPFFKEIFCAKDTRTALELAGPYLEAKYRTYAAWGQDTVMPGHESVPPALRGSPARPLRAGQPGGVLRAAPPVLGGGGRELLDS